MDRKDVTSHIEAIDAELTKNPDMQFKVELLKAKSMAMLAYAEMRTSVRVEVANADQKRFYLGGVSN